VDKIKGLDISKPEKAPDILKKLNYQKLINRIKAKVIFKEKLFQEKIYPKILVNESKCIGCGKCVSICPMQRLKMNNKGVEQSTEKPACIHCGECIAACDSSAI
jgi:heterodisulfide reductase subunit A-like polyferredoxin